MPLELPLSFLGVAVEVLGVGRVLRHLHLEAFPDSRGELLALEASLLQREVAAH